MTLREVFSGIAEAIRGKGVEGVMTPTEMSDKIEELPSKQTLAEVESEAEYWRSVSESYGIDIESSFDAVDEKGGSYDIRESPYLPDAIRSIPSGGSIPQLTVQVRPQSSDNRGAVILSFNGFTSLFSGANNPDDYTFGYSGEFGIFNNSSSVTPDGYYTVDSDTTIVIAPYYCIVCGTPISLSDGTLKNIEDITYDDNLKVWNFDEGRYDSAKPSWIQQVKTADYFWKSTFSNGKVLKTVGVHGHRVFNVTKGDFLYIDDCVGDDVLMEDGTTSTLISNEKVNESVQYRNLNTKHHINCYANGILTTCILNRIYPVENMKFVKDGRALRTKDMYSSNVTQEWFDDNRYAEQSTDIGYLNDYAIRLHPSVAEPKSN